MSENRGIFSLEEFYNLQVSGETTNILDAFRYVNSLATTGGPSYGYWAGGAASQTVTRLDFLNDTAAQAPKGPLNQTAYSFGGTASTSYAYFYGGQMAGSRIQRIDFADDTATTVLSGLIGRSKIELKKGKFLYFLYFGFIGKIVPLKFPLVSISRRASP